MKNEVLKLRSKRYELTTECNRLHDENKLKDEIIDRIAESMRRLNQRIIDLCCENENYWNEIKNRDDEIEFLRDKEYKYNNQLKSLKKKEKSMKDQLKNSYPANKVNEIWWELMAQIKDLKESSGIEKDFLWSLLDDLEAENKLMKVEFKKEIRKHEAYFDDKIWDQNKQIKSKNKIILKLENKLNKLQEKFDSLKQNLKCKYFNNKRELKIIIKESEENKDSTESQELMAQNEIITKISTNVEQEMDLSIKIGDRTKRILSILK